MQRDIDTLRCATAGSVDDGKSTLIGRLLFDAGTLHTDQLAHVEEASRRRGREAPDLSLLTDGLRAEREQGITIDAAFRYVSTGRRRLVLADAPGHVQYTRNTLTAASTADVALILVDATKTGLGSSAPDLLVQTKRHLAVARFLGVPHVAVAVNKMDAIGMSPEGFATIRDRVHAYLARLDVARGAPSPSLAFFPVSALAGDNVVHASARTPWYDGPTLLAHLEALPSRRPDVEAGARFLVQWVRRGEARGYAGRVGAGAFALGDRVRVVASGVTSSIVRIETLGEDGATRAGAGTSATFTLADSVDVARGDTLVRADDPAPSLTREVAVELAWLSREPLRVGAPYALKHGTRRVRAVVDRVEGVLDVASGEARPAEGLVMNDLGRVQLRTSEPLPWDRYDTARALGRAILIAPTTAETVGAAIHR